MSYSGLATIDARTGVGGHYSPASQRKGYDYIILHHNAGTNFDNVPRVWETRAASAHYQVGPHAIKVCLDEELVSWNAGNWDANTRSISIENVNSTGAPKWDIAPETRENCAKLVADIARRRGIPIDSDHVKGHSEFSKTSCPGSLDVNWVINRARELSGQGIAPNPGDNTPIIPKPEQGDNRIYFDYRGRVRQYPTTKSATMRIYDAGAKMDYDGYVTGEYVNGSNKWLKTSIHKWYVHESVTSGVYNLPYLGDAGATTSREITLIHDIAGHWRDKPTSKSGSFAVYRPGDSVKCKGWCYGEDPYGDGRNKWVISSRNHKYAWEGLFGGVYGLSKIE